MTVAEGANRTTTWERGDDPHTRVTFHCGFDGYGRVRRSAGVAVARGRDPRSPGPGEPPLCTVATVEYVTRDDATGYRTDLTARAAGYEVFSDGSHTLAELERALASDALPRRLRTYARNGYDGQPYVGLPLGQLGEHGLLTSTTTLALTAGTLGRDLGPDVSPYLRPPAPAHGLRGEYFRDASLGTPAFVRPDPTVDFTWFGGPDPALAQPAFSVCWTGTLTPAVSGTYTVDVEAAGPVRLWLGDQVLIDSWSDGSPDGPGGPLPTSLVALPPRGTDRAAPRGSGRAAHRDGGGTHLRRRLSAAAGVPGRRLGGRSAPAVVPGRAGARTGADRGAHAAARGNRLVTAAPAGLPRRHAGPRRLPLPGRRHRRPRRLLRHDGRPARRTRRPGRARPDRGDPGRPRARDPGYP
ncbi:hypothetical protein JNW88_05295 [Micromonospora sp. ATA32]|nr:hypothetical protein [Micromonospora sp. ATA32]